SFLPFVLASACQLRSFQVFEMPCYTIGKFRIIPLPSNRPRSPSHLVDRSRNVCGRHLRRRTNIDSIGSDYLPCPPTCFVSRFPGIVGRFHLAFVRRILIFL